MKSNIRKELVGWLREQLSKSQAKGYCFGLSGGVDSSVVAVLVKEAVGKKHLALLLSCHSKNKDLEDAKLVAEKFKLKTELIKLSRIYDSLIDVFSSNVSVRCLPKQRRIAEGNLKARLRMLTLYYFANRLNYLVVGTGNKSEIMLGYFTKFGDGGVDILPLGDMLKTEVKELAKNLGIPKRIIDKVPSAGLWSGQTDEDELGISYSELDNILESIEKGLTDKLPIKKLTKIKAMVRQTEHKRQPPRIFFYTD